MGSPPVSPDAPRAGRSIEWLWGLACLPFLAVLVYQIATSRFLCDDAFINFRYARNLMDGHGLVFNRGEYVEGFVDLLWVLELAGLWRLGLRPEVSAHVLSIALTAGTLALVVASALRLGPRSHRRLIAWLAFGLVACSTNFAVWSTSGMETRQFTFLIVLGCFLLTRTSTSLAGLLLASCVFAAAELTRPEGLLLFGCACAFCLLQDRANGQLRLRRVLSLAVPFASVVVGHYLWRHSYYGDWLPNPYHAKHVRAWYESGFNYVAAAAIELGAWLWVPLAFSFMARRATARDLTQALPFVLIVPHVLYLMRIGGDHFEYRPMDFYLPLLAVPAAAGLMQLLDWLVSTLQVDAEARRVALVRRLAVGLCVPVLVYSHGLGAASFAVAMQRQEFVEEFRSRTELDETSAPLLQFVPGLLPLCAILNPLREQLHRHLVAVPAQVHLAIGRNLVANLAAYERLPDGVFPTDAVAAANTVGVMPFYLRELSVVDIHGLTDATIARTPTTTDNRQRRMAHDRHPPPGYLRQRGVNVAVAHAATSELEALRIADFAVKVEEGVWMPLQAVDREYAQRSFPADRLAARHRVDSHKATANQLLLDGKAYDGIRLLATFEPDDAGLTWTCKGDAAVRPTRQLLMGGIGARQLSTEGDQESTEGEGSARSSEFVAEAGTMLVLFLAGQRELGVAMNLCRGGDVVRSFRPAALDHLHPVVCPLDAWTGQALHLEVSDRGAGWLVLDHVLLVQNGSAPRAALSVAWSGRQDPLSGILQIAPLHSVHGRAVSGTTTITVTNPLPCPTRLAIELVEGPVDACLLCGPWLLGEGSGIVQEIPAGATAQMHAYLWTGEGTEGTAVEQQTFTVRFRVHGVLRDQLVAPEVMVLECPLQWEERN